MNADLLVVHCPKHGRSGPLATTVQCGKCAEKDRQELVQLRGNLSLAEQGLANYAQEVTSLRKELNAYHLEISQLRAEIVNCRREGRVPEAFWMVKKP